MNCKRMETLLDDYVDGLLAASALGGLVWSLIPALLKAKLKVNEILTTLLLNYVAIILSEGFAPFICDYRSRS